MDNSTLVHHGVKGMKWGVIKKRLNKPKGKTNHEYDMSSLSNEELKERISRLRLENDYKNIISEENKFQITRGHKFVASILKDSATNIYQQMEKYVKEMEKGGSDNDGDSENE